MPYDTDLPTPFYDPLGYLHRASRENATYSTGGETNYRFDDEISRPVINEFGLLAPAPKPKFNEVPDGIGKRNLEAEPHIPELHDTRPVEERMASDFVDSMLPPPPPLVPPTAPAGAYYEMYNHPEPGSDKWWRDVSEYDISHGFARGPMRRVSSSPAAPSPAAPALPPPPAGGPPALPGPEPAPAAPSYRGRPLYVANPNDTYLEDSYSTDWARDLRAQNRLSAPTRLEQAVGAAAAAGGVPPDLQAALDAQDADIAKRRRAWLGGRSFDDAISLNDRLGARAELARANAELAARREQERFALAQDAATGRAAIEAAGQAAAADAANAWRLPSAQAEAQGRVDAATAQAAGAAEAARLRAQGVVDAATAQAAGRTAAAQARADALRDAARIQQQRPVYGNDGKTLMRPVVGEDGRVDWTLEDLSGSRATVVGETLVDAGGHVLFDGRQDPRVAATLRRLDVLQRAYASAAGDPNKKEQAAQLLKDINDLYASLPGAGGAPAPAPGAAAGIPPATPLEIARQRAERALAEPRGNPGARGRTIKRTNDFWTPGQ